MSGSRAGASARRGGADTASTTAPAPSICLGRAGRPAPRSTEATVATSSTTRWRLRGSSRRCRGQRRRKPLRDIDRALVDGSTAAQRRVAVSALPPGQRALEGFPRFGKSLTGAPPVPPERPVIEFRGVGIESFTVQVTDLLRADRREVVTDFHCVAGWSATNLRWEGVPFHTVYRETVAPRLAPDTVVSHITFRGLDGWRSVLTIDDALERVRDPGRPSQRR